MTTDTDGAPRMVVWGASGPPTHDDGAPVITRRLYERLTPFEKQIYSGDDLRAHLAARVYWRTAGETIDGWDPDDFVSFGLAEAAKYEWYTVPAVVTWVNRKIDSVRRKADRIRFEELENHDQPADEYRATQLPDDVRTWVDQHLPARQARVVQLYAEGLTPTEAAGTVGISRTKFYEALHTLKGHLG